MNKLKNGLLYTAILISTFVWKSYGQDRPIYTQYMFNETAFNPAYTGVPDQLSMTGLYRKQWVGIDGAPSTQTFSIHSPLKNEKLAIGFQALRDAIGVTTCTELQSMYAYRIRLNDKSKLSMGIQMGVRWMSEDFSQLYNETEDSQFSESNRQAKFLFGTGLYYHTERFYVGASVPVVQTKNNAKNHYFITSGYVFDLSSQLKLKPNVLIKLADNAPVSYDLNANLLISEIIWFGLSYRSLESLGILTQLQLTEKLSLGYAYDMPVTGISPYGSGSHEITLNYKIKILPTSFQSPRYF
uniref:Type IX secretion system membrane protein PorP/SprF n=1 Tax=Roseihalotalea indica TaxID=2867963 RepID=A0AA49GLP2_9BACT|nr:type IX secretion system membrane protein PorP/SprF [Tunicatimonas sp. TK19036]